jgi:hypothetical protein
MDLTQFFSVGDLAVRENDLSSSMGPNSGDSWTPRAAAPEAGIIMPRQCRGQWTDWRKYVG